MPKTRLNADIRNRLRNFAKKNVSVAKEERSLERAYAKAAKLVTEAVRKKCPENEMAVLKKHDVTIEEREFRLADASARVTQFTMRRPDCLSVPRSYRYNAVFAASNACMKAVDDWELKESAHNEARKKVLDRYYAVIAASRYVEDVIEVWPAVSPILEQFLSERGKNLPAAVSDETI
ncbi:MAG: hypothetical protein JJ979_02400, partial [Roseibium sp.]|nr:hypothetical protein [Roseibium sp.]